MNYCTIDSPIGELYIYEDNNKIVNISSAYIHANECRQKITALLEKAICQLEEYFEGNRRDFTLPLELEGTPFQKRVWNALREIPYGETRSYKDIAKMVDSPKAFRAVGGANHNNPIMIVVPCHRVIGASGKLTGYAGGLDKKQILLQLEAKDRH